MLHHPRFLLMVLLLSCNSSPAMAATEFQSRIASQKTQAEEESNSLYLSEAELAKHLPTINRLEKYLSELTTVEAHFTQTSSDGSVGEGTFYLQRPRQMRWEYAPPVPILIVSSGNELVYFDKELEQVSRIPIDSTLAGFLAKDKIIFGGDVGIEQISEEASVIRITISQREKPDEGLLTLEFSDSPLLLRRMIIIDATGQSTNVSLNNAKFGSKLSPKLFVFKDTRKKRPK